MCHRDSAECEHRYGERVHLLNDFYLLNLVNELSEQPTLQPRFNEIVEECYERLFQWVANRYVKRYERDYESRMIEYAPQARFRSPAVDPEQSVVLTDLARGGIVPSYVGFQFFCKLLPANNIRLDHIFVNRATNEAEEVVGAHVAGMKIGGPVSGRLHLIPDPMGATGSTLIQALDSYRQGDFGRAERMISLHLMVAPEFLRNVLRAHPTLEVVALRLDRGLSSARALEAVPGTYWDEERGLNEKGYIVPGAGGVGEIMNNAYV